MKLIGVAGGSGSGKTTFARLLAGQLGLDQVTIISQDSYYIDRSQDFHGDGSLNFDHPDVIDWKLMAKHLSALESGESIEMPIYDFSSHKRKLETRLIAPTKHIVVDGILIYASNIMREIFDIRFFIDTSEPVRFERRLKRDMLERGRTRDGVTVQYQKSVLPMHNQYVEPTKQFADHIIDGQGDFLRQLQTILNRWP